jgi:PAS domain S-box-containing protein
LGLLLCGIALWLQIHEPLTLVRRRMARACGLIACLSAMVTISEYLFTMDLGIDRRLLPLRDVLQQPQADHIVLPTAFALLALGLALVWLDGKSGHRHSFSQYGALMGGMIGAVALVGYLYGVQSLYKMGTATISPFAALILLALGIGILCARPTEGFMATLASEDLGGLMLRRVLPFAIILPILAGWIRITAQRSGHYGFTFGVALAVACVMLIMLAFLWLLAGTLNRTDGQKKHILQILHQREARHRLALKAGRMGTFHEDLDSHALLWSPELESIFGLPPMSFGSTFAAFQELIHPDDRTGVERIIRKAIDDRSAYDLECRILRPHAAPNEAWIAVTGQVLPDAYGRPRQITGVIFDITERKQAEQALRESEERFRHLFEQASDGIVMADMAGHYLDVNRRACHMLGYSREELLERKVTDILTPHDNLRLKDIQADLLAGHRHSSEWKLRRKAGGTVSVEVSARLQPDGRWHAIVRDITERKRAEAGLRESEAHFRMLADAAPVLIWMAGADKLCTWMNRSWLEYTGRDLEDELGNGWTEGVHPDDVTQCRDTYARYFDRHEPFEMEYRLRKHDGTYGWILDRGVPLLRTDGTFTGYLGAALDITDRKQAEEQLREWTEELEQRVQERTQALVLSQERLRALASDLSSTEQQERRRLATELHDYLAQLLVVGRMKLGQAKPQVQDQKTQQLLNEADDALTQSLNYTRFLVAELSPQVLYQFGLPAALKWLATQMKSHGLTVTAHCDITQLQLAEETAAMLYQSVRELLFNVIKHAGTDHASISLTCHGEGTVTITVADKGCGFDSSGMETDRHHPGRFGLFNVQERLEAVGGKLELTSRQGGGTSISLTAPLGDPVHLPHAPAAAGPVPHRAASPIPSSQRLRILLVDDHAMVRQGLRSVLEGYQDLEVIGEAGDGESAITLAGALKPDVVVMDVNMPKIDGIEATRHILSNHPDLIVIGLSVQNERHVEEAMLNAGAAVFVTKERAALQLYEAITGTVRAKA